MNLKDTLTGQAIYLKDQRDRDLMQEALQRALNTWEDAPADIRGIYDQLRDGKHG